MKSIKLAGHALELAKAIHQAHLKHHELHEAWEEKQQREHEQLAKNSHTEIAGLLGQLAEAIGINPETDKPQLDIRYVMEHGIAFMILADEDDDQVQLDTAELVQ